MKCEFCDKEGTNKSISQHKIRCKKNPNKILLYDRSGKNNPNFGNKHSNKTSFNQYTKAEKLGYSVVISEETREKFRKSSKGRKLTEKQLKIRSIAMKKAVKDHPESYNASNINGRTKKISYGGFVMDGSWEYKVAVWLDFHKIKWTKPLNGFEYEWKGKRLYYPDFYLPTLDLFIEVKGYERERDQLKWAAVKNLIVIKRAEIEQIVKGVDPITILK